MTFRRARVQADELAESAMRHFRRITRKHPGNLQLKVDVCPSELIGDVVLLRFMLESLLNEAMTHPQDGWLELHVYQQGAFVRFDFIDRRRSLSQEELNHLFYPHLSRMQESAEGVLAGTEYLVCKQIIRDHDEFAGRRGCRINACEAEGGGFMVWFTLPSR